MRRVYCLLTTFSFNNFIHLFEGIMPLVLVTYWRIIEIKIEDGLTKMLSSKDVEYMQIKQRKCMNVRFAANHLYLQEI